MLTLWFDPADLGDADYAMIHQPL